MNHTSTESSVKPMALASEPRQQATSMIDDVLARIDGLHELIADELQEYKSLTVDWEVMGNDPLKVSVVIPVFNERDTVARVIGRVAALPLNKEIVVVDDCSSDGTMEVLEKLSEIPGVKVVFHRQNQGKGAALRTAFEQVSGDVIVIQDADLEYDPREIPQLLTPIARNEADVVYGSRFIGGARQTKSQIHQLGNGLLTWASNLLNGLQLTDMETCYKAFSREALKCLDVSQDRFGVEPELTAKLARRGYRFTEVPISYRPRGYAEGKKIGVRDLFKAVYCIGRYGVAD